MDTHTPDTADQYVSVVVTMPRTAYTAEAREALNRVLGSGIDDTTIDVLHFASAAGASTERSPWDDQTAALAAADPRLATEVVTAYLAALPATYKEQTSPEHAVEDIAAMHTLSAGTIETSLHRGATALRFALYTLDQPIILSALIPVLQSLGFSVLDEYPFTVAPVAAHLSRIYVLHLQSGTAATVDDVALARVQDTFAAIRRGDTDADRFNELVLAAGLEWRQTVLLRAYTAYLRQLGLPHSAQYIQQVLLAHPVITADLVEYFGTRFDPDRAAPTATTEALADRIRARVDEVTSLDADRILRALLGVISATVRTNYFVRTDDGQPRAHLSFKLSPRDITGITVPAPRPLFEIFVHSPHTEGVHLRFGAVARGGLRWSDRPEDYRTEILGLVKAQTVKNAVIVPVGAKGGFVLRRPPTPTGDPHRDRAAQLTEAQACYRTFISGLLDITDNIDTAAQSVRTPARVLRYDDPDPYLVVAADKGTATFSDLANTIAADVDFWLRDAFASGGSIGYDHKALGITAKGAWESVKRHFRELGHDTQNTDFTVAGIGDMSGDVFGNGMLLSPHIRLIAAFDHRHIFIDPTPDAARSYTERARLFGLDRSTWKDYDPAVISRGGGIFDRTAKSIRLNDEIRAALGIEPVTGAVTPAELIRAILTAPVDLLWNGGVGTYVKAADETHSDVGDKTNDHVRIDANRLRARVIGEGGNLGLTQRARIEFAREGGKINTDAFDNSAGVNCSDHEVNIKIVLETLTRNGTLNEDQRRQLLADMAGDVTALVLNDNINQNELLGISRVDPAGILGVQARLIDHLEQGYGLDRALETLPDRDQVLQLEQAGIGLSSPELATLLAHVKLALKTEMLDSALPDVDVFVSDLPHYFPTALALKHREAITKHPLRREIVTTMVINDVVETGGISYAFRLQEETGVGATDAIRAHAATSRIYDLTGLRQAISSLEQLVGVHVTDELSLATRRLLDQASRWLLLHRPQPLAIGAEVSRFHGAVTELIPDVACWLRGREATAFAEAVDRLCARGVAPQTARWFTSHLHALGLLGVVDIADLTEQPTRRVAELYYALSDILGVGILADTIFALPAHDKWHYLARLTLREEVLAVLRAMTIDILLTAPPGDSVDDLIAEWRASNTARILRAGTVLEEIGAIDVPDIAIMSVAVGHLRAMVQGTSRRPALR